MYAIISVILLCFIISFSLYVYNKNNEILDKDLQIKNLYVNSNQIKNMYKEHKKEIENLVSDILKEYNNEMNFRISMPLYCNNSSEIKIYASENNSIILSENLKNNLKKLNNTTGLNSIDYINTHTYEQCTFTQSNFKNNDFNSLIYLNIKNEDKFTIERDNLNKLLFPKNDLIKYTFSYIKIIESNDNRYWLFSATRTSNNYSVYYKLYDILYNNIA